MIPKNIKRDHVLEAMKEIDSKGVPGRKRPTRYSLIFNKKGYPPKLVLSIANKFANGEELDSNTFGGGNQTNCFLTKLGFEIAKLTKARIKEARPPIENSNETGTKTHDERCPKCKETIRRILERIYGKVEQNYRFNVGTNPEIFRRTPYYEKLLEIHKALQDYRGFKDFVRTGNLPNCDFFIPNPGFILEYDESQHFTKSRAIALKRYPASLRLAFDRNTWIKMCYELDKKDNDPPYRDEQRAWYDSLRDFCSNIFGISIIRIFPNEHIWCSFDENNEDDIERFKYFIEGRLITSAILRNQEKQTRYLKIGLAFPELGKHDLEYFLRSIRNSKNNLNLLIFPEAFERIESEDSIRPDEVTKTPGFGQLSKTYAEISKELSISIIVGVSVDYKNKSLSGKGNDQYCLFITPLGKSAFYHKHTSSKYTAFFDDFWSIEDNFPVLSVEDRMIGISICHDSYISLIPKILRKKGADIWVNISYQNVRAHVWEAVLQTRSVENKIISLCTLHRNSKASNGEGRPQKEPYAFSEEGKIRLKELADEKYLDEIDPENRTGKIYYFSTPTFESLPNKFIEESAMPNKAGTISIIKGSGVNYEVEEGIDEYYIDHISVNEFVYSPEKIWQVSLKKRNKTTLFIVWVKNAEEWDAYRSRVEKIIKGRIVEFSTLFIFLNRENDKILMAGYRSSNYKDSRIFYPEKFPIIVDSRYLKGMKSIYEISFDDRSKSEDLYFQRINRMIQFVSVG